MRIRKPTREERDTYSGIHPLYGFVKAPFNGKRIECVVEYLGEGPDNPNYEALAPNGMMFDSGYHTLLGETLAELYERVSEDILILDTESTVS